MKSKENNNQHKTPLLNFLSRVKKWFTRRRCIFLGIILFLFIFLYNPTKIDVLFKAIPEDAIATIYINSLSDEWDEAMKNNMLMGSISVILKEDLSQLRKDENIKTMLSLLTGNDSVVSAIDVNGDKEINLEEGDYLAGVTSIGFRRRIMELLWHIKYVPGLGDLGVTEDGIRYLDFSKNKNGPSANNPVLALDVVNGVLCVAYTINPSDINHITTRINDNTGVARVFKGTEEPWMLLTSNAIPKNFILWTDSFDGIVSVSSFAEENIEVRVVDTRETTEQFFRNVKTFSELGISNAQLAAQHAPAENLMLSAVFNNTLFDAYDHFTHQKYEKKLDNTLFSFAMLGDSYSFDVLGSKFPSIHISTDKQGINEGETALEEYLCRILTNRERSYVDQYNWRTTYSPEFSDFNPILANIRFGLYIEQRGGFYNQGVASLASIKRGKELPKKSDSNVYTVGNMFEFLGEECGSSYFVGYCNVQKGINFIKMLQPYIKLAKMFGIEVREDCIDYDMISLVAGKFSEAETLSCGVSKLNDVDLCKLLQKDNVYCWSFNLMKKGK